jgi:hypothetical protein
VDQARAEELGRLLGLVGAQGDLAAPLAAGDGEDDHRVAGGGVAQEDAADADLDVVGVGADGQHDVVVLGPPLARAGDELGGLGDQAIAVERLGQVVVGAGADGRDGVVEPRPPGHHQRDYRGLGRLDVREEVDPVHAGQLDVGDDEVPPRLREQPQRLLGVGRPVRVRDRGEQLDDDAGEISSSSTRRTWARSSAIEPTLTAPEALGHALLDFLRRRRRLVQELGAPELEPLAVARSEIERGVDEQRRLGEGPVAAQLLDEREAVVVG